jgi:flagellar protein FliS
MDQSQNKYIDEYMDSSVSTQDRGKLIIMLYDGAIKFLNIAKDKLAEDDYEQKGLYIGKAQDIVSELNNSLDMDIGGEVSQNLRGLYNFLYRHLSEANIERDVEKIDECIEILDELRDAWEQAAQAVATEGEDEEEVEGEAQRPDPEDIERSGPSSFEA